MNKLSKKILLTQGQEAIVDDEDFLLLSQYKWYAAKQKYTFYAERYAMIITCVSVQEGQPLFDKLT